MRALRTSFTLLALAAASLLPAQDSDQARADRDRGNDPPRAPRIAVVDVFEVFSQYGTAIKEQKEIEALQKKINEELSMQGKEIDSTKAALSVLKVGSPAYEMKEFELRSKIRQRDDLVKLRRRQLERRSDEAEFAFYRDLDHAIAKLAAERGFDIVLRREDPIDPSELGKEGGDARKRARLGRYRQRTVWFASRAVDMTPAVVEYLQVCDCRAERLAAEKAAEAAARKKAPKKAAGASGNDEGK